MRDDEVDNAALSDTTDIFLCQGDRNDWFSVVIEDLTSGRSRIEGGARCVGHAGDRCGEIFRRRFVSIIIDGLDIYRQGRRLLPGEDGDLVGAAVGVVSASRCGAVREDHIDNCVGITDRVLRDDEVDNAALSDAADIFLRQGDRNDWLSVVIKNRDIFRIGGCGRANE